LENIKKLTRDTDGDGKIDTYGFGMRGSTGGHEAWASFIHAYGGNFKDLTSPEVLKGMTDFVNIYKNGYAPPSAPTDGFPEIIANFKSGRAAMIIHHVGSSPDMIKTFGDDVEAFIFPQGPGGRWTCWAETDNMMLESSKHKDAAFEWLKYLAVGKGQETWCTVTGNLPVSDATKSLPYFQKNRFVKVSLDGLPYGGIYPNLPNTAEFISVVWPNTIAAALAGTITPGAALQALQKGLYGD
jgi:multiple sugar transport system substrate-binding protein